MVLHCLGDAIVDVFPARELLFLPFASALQATIARLRAALSALDGFVASAGRGISPATLTSSTAMKAVTLMDRDKTCSALRYSANSYFRESAS